MGRLYAPIHVSVFVDRQILALRVRLSVRVASAGAWVKTRQGIGASKVMEGN